MVEKSNVPEIRFAGFADPWEQRKLGELVDIKDSARIPNRCWKNAGVPYIRASDVSQEKLQGTIFLSEETYLSYAKVTGAPEPGDVLFNGGGEIGKAIVNYRPTPIYVQGGAVLYAKTARSTLLHELFLVSAFESQSVMSNISIRSAGGTMRHFTLKPANALPITVPQYAEQRQIGQLFSRLDALITLHQRKYDKLGELKKSLLEKMFPKEGEVFPEIRFAGFADPWEQRKLGELVDVRSGRDYQHLEEGPIPVYGTGGYMTGVNEALSYDEDAIGIGRKGTIDKPYRLFAPFWTVDTLFYAVPRENVNLDFALCLFRNVDWKSKDESTGLPSLSKTIINESDVYVPRNPEQRQIGQLFSRLDALITLHQRKLELLRNIKKALLDKMFVEGE